MTTVVVSGALANKAGNGGEAWVRLNWVLGLQRLGFRVHFIEEVGRGTCVDAAGAVTPFERSINLAFFREVTERFGLAGSAALIYEGGEQIHGSTSPELFAVADAAALLVNISGHLSLQPLFSRFRRKAYIDIDPGFTQFWHAAGTAGARLEGHDFHFTIAENIGADDCPIPPTGIRWRTTRPPVVLTNWPASTEGDANRFTTVANWRGPFGAVQVGGRTYGLKVHQFRKLIELPRRANQTFEIALNIHPADDKDRRLLLEHGWQLVDPQAVAPDPWAFRRYVQTSGGEFSVAQGIYVETNSGWFSDRTVHYLASGKPVLVQDTGFSRHLPGGLGLVPFRAIDDAAAGANKIGKDYAAHARAARAIAEEYFDSDKVLTKLLAEVDISA
jgi:hypothetical protein